MTKAQYFASISSPVGRRLLGRTPVRDNANRRLVLVARDHSRDDVIPYADLTSTDWGLVYERVVGVAYEAEGYTVEQRGITHGLADRGIDVVATRNDGHQVFVQCKGGHKKLGKQAIETILYNGGNFIYKHRCCASPEFVLAAPDLEALIAEHNRIHFLRHNGNEFRVRLLLREIPWIGSHAGPEAGDLSRASDR